MSSSSPQLRRPTTPSKPRFRTRARATNGSGINARHRAAGRATTEGFDLELIGQVKDAVAIPVIASSGAGRPEHFEEVFRLTGADAALGAGIFHRDEYTVGEVKEFLDAKGMVVRRD